MNEQENNYRDLTVPQLHSRLQLTNKEITDLFGCIDILIERAKIIVKIINAKSNQDIEHDLQDK